MTARDIKMMTLHFVHLLIIHKTRFHRYLPKISCSSHDQLVMVDYVLKTCIRVNISHNGAAPIAAPGTHLSSILLKKYMIYGAFYCIKSRQTVTYFE